MGVIRSFNNGVHTVLRECTFVQAQIHMFGEALQCVENTNSYSYKALFFLLFPSLSFENKTGNQRV